MALTVEKEVRDGGVAVIVPVGWIDAATAGELDAVVAPLAADAATNRMVFDMTGVDYLASAGLRVFLGVVKAMRPKNGAVAFAGLKEEVRAVLKTAGILRLTEEKPSVEECL